MIPSATRWQIASRIAASFVGGWILVWGFVVLAIALLRAAGLTYADAQTLVYLLAFVVFLAAFCWSFATRTALRAWLVQVGLGATMTALAWWLTRTST